MKRITLLITIMALVVAFGCSSGADNPVAVGDVQHNPAQACHYTWGLWTFSADPEAGTLDVTRIRGGDMHLNALQFLEPPPLVNLTLESVQFNGNIVEADIGLRHPFLGLNEFTGFDVCGILITSGSVDGFTDPDIVMASEGDTRLLNPDGFSRWWNPSEFPVNNGTMFSYKDGMLGTPDSISDFNSTLNAYKFFTNDLADPDDPVSGIDPESRCVFNAGSKNIRHYSIELGAGLIFNYAVDASWVFPTGDKPWVVPDSFPPEANRPEAWNALVTESVNTLWNDGVDNGGDLSLSIDIWDHYNAELNTVFVESPGNFDPVGPISPTGGGAGYSTYEIDITSATPAETSIDILIIAESEVTGYQDSLPGKPVSAYFVHMAPVDNEEPSEPADPIEGNVALQVLRDGVYAINGIKLLWTGNGNPEYAIYADLNPYDGIDPDMFIDATAGEEITINATNYPDFSTAACYGFTVRARSQAGSQASESTDSQYAFVDLEDFDGGDDPSGGWELYYRDPANQFTVTTGTIDGNALKQGPSVNEIWNAAVSPMIPAIGDTEYSVIEVAQRASYFLDNAWPECIAAMYAQTTVGWADGLPTNGAGNWKNLHSPPLDAGIDGTWPLEDQLNPTSQLVSITWFFSGAGHGWRVYFLDRDSDPPPIRFSRISIPELHENSDVYASWAFGDHNTQADQIGLVEPVYCDEIAVIIY